MAGVSRARGLNKLRVTHRLGANDGPAHPSVQVTANGLQIADSAADLDGQLWEAPGDCRDCVLVHRLARESTVEVHQVQPFGTLLHPLGRHGNRVIAEGGAVLHAALAQPNALAVFEVDGGNHNERHGGPVSGG